uniref:Uncharacterized protein n=1 Tax=Percolomonas cosmopolitus TaxID=63605 RepID=A0A7S1KKN4_9EUKA
MIPHIANATSTQTKSHHYDTKSRICFLLSKARRKTNEYVKKKHNDMEVYCQKKRKQVWRRRAESQEEHAYADVNVEGLAEFYSNAIEEAELTLAREEYLEEVERERNLSTSACSLEMMSR